MNKYKTEKNMPQDLSQNERNLIKLQGMETSLNGQSVSFSQKIEGGHPNQSLMGLSTKPQRLSTGGTAPMIAVSMLAVTTFMPSITLATMPSLPQILVDYPQSSLVVPRVNDDLSESESFLFNKLAKSGRALLMYEWYISGMLNPKPPRSVMPTQNFPALPIPAIKPIIAQQPNIALPQNKMSENFKTYTPNVNLSQQLLDSMKNSHHIVNVPGNGKCGWLALIAAKKAQEVIGQNSCNPNLTLTVTNEDLRNLLSQVAKLIRSDAKNVSQSERMQNLQAIITAMPNREYSEKFSLCSEIRTGQKGNYQVNLEILAQSIEEGKVQFDHEFAPYVPEIFNGRPVIMSNRHNDTIKEAQGDTEPTSNDLIIYYKSYEAEGDDGDGECYGNKGHYQTIVPKSIMEINFEEWKSPIPQLMISNDDDSSDVIVISKPNNNPIRHPQPSPAVPMRQLPLPTKTQTARSAPRVDNSLADINVPDEIQAMDARQQGQKLLTLMTSWRNIDKPVPEKEIEQALQYIKAGANLKTKRQDGSCVLHLAANKRNTEKIIHVCAYNQDLSLKNSITSERKTPLMIAARSGNIEGARILISAYASLQAKDSKGMTALMHAIKGENDNIVNLLLQKEAGVNMKDNNHQTPLIHAAKMGNNTIIEKLLKLINRTVSQKDKDGHSALWYCMNHGNWEGVELISNRLKFVCNHPELQEMEETLNNAQGNNNLREKCQRAIKIINNKIMEKENEINKATEREKI